MREPADASRPPEPATSESEQQPAQSTDRRVLMQRVIALNGVVNSPKQAEPFPPKAAPVENPGAPHRPTIDLAATALEWGAERLAAKVTPTPVPETLAARPSTSSPQSQLQPQPAQSQGDDDAQWASYSSISMRPVDDLLLSQRILRTNIEDAVTMQYDPAATARAMAAGSTIVDLASLDRALESAGVPHDQGFQLPSPAPQTLAPTAPKPVKLLVVPASLAWTVLGAFALCALALAYFVVAFFLCDQPFALDPRTLRCVP